MGQTLTKSKGRIASCPGAHKAVAFNDQFEQQELCCNKKKSILSGKSFTTSITFYENQLQILTAAYVPPPSSKGKRTFGGDSGRALRTLVTTPLAADAGPQRASPLSREAGPISAPISSLAPPGTLSSAGMGTAMDESSFQRQTSRTRDRRGSFQVPRGVADSVIPQNKKLDAAIMLGALERIERDGNCTPAAGLSSSIGGRHALHG